MRSLIILGIALIVPMAAGCSAKTISVAESAPAAPANPPAANVDAKQAEIKQLQGVNEATAPEEDVKPGGTQAVPTVDEAVRQPATVAEAAGVLDLAAFPRLPAAKDISARVATLGYQAPGDIKSAFEFQRHHLLERGWKELSDAQIYDGSGSGQFGKAGFHISVTVTSASEAGQVSVRLHNHSNMNLSKLPVPAGAKLQYAFPGVASFETTVGVEETTAAVRKLLLDDGWKPYGSAGDSLHLKKNAVTLNARVLAPPAQPGKTVIDYSAMQMSADLPAPADGEHTQYSDQLKQLNVVAMGTPNEVAAYYQTALAPAGWKSTLERPVANGVESFMVFRNPAKELLHLDMWDLRSDKKTRVTLRHQSEAEVEELERQVDAAIAAKKKKDEEDRNKPKPTAAIALPPEAQDVQAEKNEIEFQLTTGKGKAAADAIVKQLVAAGWKSEVIASEPMLGQTSLKKDEQSITVLFVDPGFIPAQITISTMGVELERK